MNGVEAALRGIGADLDRHGITWALVGGFAVSARAEPRFTRDVDVAVAITDDREAEALVHALISDGYRLLAAVEQDAVERLATVRLAPALDEGVVVDVLFASSGIETEIVHAAEAIEILPGLTVPVPGQGTLLLSSCWPATTIRGRRISPISGGCARLPRPPSWTSPVTRSS